MTFLKPLPPFCKHLRTLIKRVTTDKRVPHKKAKSTEVKAYLTLRSPTSKILVSVKFEHYLKQDELYLFRLLMKNHLNFTDEIVLAVKLSRIRQYAIVVVVTMVPNKIITNSIHIVFQQGKSRAL